MQALGLDVDRFEADRRDPGVLDRVTRAVRAAMRGGVAATPTIVLDGELHAGPPDAGLLARLTAGAAPRGDGAVR